MRGAPTSILIGVIGPAILLSVAQDARCQGICRVSVWWVESGYSPTDSAVMYSTSIQMMPE